MMKLDCEKYFCKAKSETERIWKKKWKIDESIKQISNKRTKRKMKKVIKEIKKNGSDEIEKDSR